MADFVRLRAEVTQAHPLVALDLTHGQFPDGGTPKAWAHIPPAGPSLIEHVAAVYGEALRRAERPNMYIFLPRCPVHFFADIDEKRSHDGASDALYDDEWLLVRLRRICEALSLNFDGATVSELAVFTACTPHKRSFHVHARMTTGDFASPSAVGKFVEALLSDETAIDPAVYRCDGVLRLPFMCKRLAGGVNGAQRRIVSQCPARRGVVARPPGTRHGVFATHG